jgi:hypothetical protein
MDQELGRKTVLLAHHIDTFHRQLNEMREVWAKTIKPGDVVRYGGAPVVVGERIPEYPWMYFVTDRDPLPEDKRLDGSPALPRKASDTDLWPWTDEDDAIKATIRQYTAARLKIEAKIFAGDKLLLSQIEALVVAEPDLPVSEDRPSRVW